MSKQCVFCQKEFLHAPPEHVIPKSIGGQYTIHNVCKDCNSNLNKKIDEPFKNHQLLSTYRFSFSTNGRSKSIKNPLSGEYINIDGIKYTAKLNDDLTADATMKPIFPKIADLKIGDQIQIQVDEKDIDKVDDYRKKVAEKLNIPVEEIHIKKIDKTFRPESIHVINTNNNIMLLEFTKILFQTSSDILGDNYLNDPIAIKYRTMLISGKINESIKEYILPNEQITSVIFLQLQPSAQRLNNQHLIVISGFVGIGLIGFLKIYNSYHVQILSTSNEFYRTGMKIITNDFENNKLGIFEPNKLPNCDISINRIHIGKDEAILNSEFQKNDPQTNYPVLNSEEKIIAKSLFELIDNHEYTRKTDTDFMTNMKVTIFSNDTIFIRSKSIDKLIPIESVTYNFSISTLKIRGF